MFVPRAVDYLSTLPTSFFPASGNDTLSITCTPGPCQGHKSPKHNAAQCVAVFSSLENGISQSIKYCVKTAPDEATKNASLFSQFAGHLRSGFEVCLAIVAWLLAIAVVILALIFFCFLIGFIFEVTGISAAWARAQERSKAAKQAAAAASASGEGEAPGAAAVEMSNLPAEGENRSHEEREDDLAESASQATDDATQWDESESAQLLVDKKTVDS